MVSFIVELFGDGFGGGLAVVFNRTVFIAHHEYIMITANLGGPDKVVIVGDGLTGDPDADFEKARKQAIIPGFYVYHLALAMDLHRTLLGGTGIQRYESKALWRDQGQYVVGFWEGVNGLKDYSGYFPDRKPPRGNDPDDRGGRSPVGQLKPVF